ncbi:MAG: [FeFe] hydrogenase H-cluster radical SAM maturase HydE, partial [Desulfofundulus sp.]
KEPPGELELTLKVLAVSRLLLPGVHLPATTALGTVHPAGRRLGLCFGANVIMPDATPPPYRYYYQIYPGKANLHEDLERTVVSLKDMIASLSRKVGVGPGHSPKTQKIQEG